MRARTYLDLIDEVEASEMDQGAKAVCIEILRRRAAVDGVVIVDRSERVKYAQHLLHEHVERAVIRERLMTRYGIGRSQAYAVIADALNVRRFAEISDAGAV